VDDLTPNNAQAYYNERYQPWLPARHRWRQYRTETFEGVWDKLTIPSLKHAKRYFSSIPPKTIFYSVIQHTDPRRMGSKINKKGFQIGNHLIVGLDLPFDFDMKGSELTYEALGEVRARTLKFYRFLLTRPELDMLYICFTGGKGFHILCNQNNLKLTEDPKKRLAQVTHDRKIYISKLLKEYNQWNNTVNICPFDYEISVDPYRFMRLPETAHKSGFVCKLIDPDQLYCPLQNFYVHHVNGGRPAIPITGEMTNILLRKRDEKVEETGRTSPSIYLFTYITSEVIGSPKNNIVILKYKAKPLNFIEPILHKLINSYKLTDLYLFKDRDTIYVVSLRVFQKERLKKIYARSLADNRHEFSKYGRTYMKAGYIRDETNNVVGKTTKFIKMIPTQYDEYISYGHYYLFKNHGIKMKGFIYGTGECIVSLVKGAVHTPGEVKW